MKRFNWLKFYRLIQNYCLNYKKQEVIQMSKNKDELITIEDFAKIKMRIGKIIEVEQIQNSDKLYKLIIDIKDKKIQCVAGLKDYYTMEQLKGRLVPVVLNLKPAKLRGVVSEGMILAAQYKDNVKILVPEDDIEIGAKIR
ncbi:MAG: methionine--tRNA ligase subunit beta [Candidatus Helarchaeota archaeon]